MLPSLIVLGAAALAAFAMSRWHRGNNAGRGAAGGYFPGLVTSPFIGVAGVLLWRKLAVTSQEVQ